MSTPAQRRTANARARLKRLERELKKGRVPTLKVYTPGAEQLYAQYGVDTTDLYIPQNHLAPTENDAARKKLQYNRKRKQEKTDLISYLHGNSVLCSNFEQSSNKEKDQ